MIGEFARETNRNTGGWGGWNDQTGGKKAFDIANQRSWCLGSAETGVEVSL
jgi:hypothetical protein